MSFLLSWLSGLLSWLMNLGAALPLHLWVLVLGGLQAAVNAIPVPGFFSKAAGYVQNLPPMVAFLSGAMEIPFGVGIVLSAYLARWILRRIPLIG